jgi:hypothetical protein
MSIRSLRKRKDSEEVEYPAYGITGTISLYQSRVNSDPGWFKNGYLNYNIIVPRRLFIPALQ